MRKQCKRKQWGLNAPAIRLTDVHARDLALQAHAAAARIDDAACINAFVHILTVTTAAMAVDKTSDEHSDRIIKSCISILERMLKTEKVTPEQEVYVKQTAGFITEWVQAGRITYRGLTFAKRSMKRLDQKLGVQ